MKSRGDFTLEWYGLVTYGARLREGGQVYFTFRDCFSFPLGFVFLENGHWLVVDVVDGGGDDA